MADLTSQEPINTPKDAEQATVYPSEYMQSLSKHKLIMIQECDKSGNASGTIIYGLLTDGDMSVESQWQTPFENSNPESKMPSLAAGLQTGTLVETISLLADKALGAGDKVKDAANSLGMDGLEGKSNFTKTNSVQVFLSTSSLRLSLSLAFLAYKDAKLEVENQIEQLQKWALPKKLGNSIFQEMSLFPTEIPPFVSVTYAGKTYKPFVIESVSAPIVAATDKDGNRLNATVSISLVSRSAIDSNDVSDKGFDASWTASTS